MSKRILLASLMIIAIALGVFAGVQKKGKGGQAANTPPTTLIHFITVKWKDDATEAQKQAAFAEAKAMVGKVPGLHRVWTDKVVLQTQTADGKPYDAIIAMEFTDQAALKAYTTHPASKKWYDAYMPIRQESRTHDVTNKPASQS
ncbi:MAG TPA: Dabb family protein [Blastocatellia bacterium]|nr:Dabb family protein [Blastocatellia bacterium]